MLLNKYFKKINLCLFNKNIVKLWEDQKAV